MPAMADAAAREHPGDIDAAVLDFADRVGAAAARAAAGQATGAQGAGDTPAAQQESGGSAPAPSCWPCSGSAPSVAASSCSAPVSAARNRSGVNSKRSRGPLRRT